jgi:pimeloyl-ACP methyl ester carboxylesterase
MKALSRLILLAVLGYLGAAAWLYINQRDLLFVVDHHRKSENGFSMTAKNGEKVWVSAYNTDKSKALIYFPGNTESDWEYPERIAKNFPGHSIYFIHYRGFGKSEGGPSQKALYEDALNLFDKVATSHEHIDIIGRSLGSAMAVYTAANRDAGKMVLVTPFAGIAMLASRRYPWIPVGLLLKDHFPSSDFAPKIEEKTLVLLSEHDTTVPYASSKKLIDSMKNKPETIMLRGVSHNAAIHHPLYIKSLREFLIE